MKVGTTTAAATNQGLIAGRLAALGASVTLLTRGFLQKEPGWKMILRAAPVSALKGRCGLWELWSLRARVAGHPLPMGLAEVDKTAASVARR
jgi:hypothetical protein